MKAPLKMPTLDRLELAALQVIFCERADDLLCALGELYGDDGPSKARRELAERVTAQRVALALDVALGKQPAGVEARKIAAAVLGHEPPGQDMRHVARHLLRLLEPELIVASETALDARLDEFRGYLRPGPLELLLQGLGARLDLEANRPITLGQLAALGCTTAPTAQKWIRDRKVKTSGGVHSSGGGPLRVTAADARRWLELRAPKAEQGEAVAHG